MNANTGKDESRRFRILVCLDGSDESYRGLRYAAKLGSCADTDIVLFYIRLIGHRPVDDTLDNAPKAGNLLAWEDEVPGVDYLKKAQDLLVELGVMERTWQKKSYHIPIEGDSIGDNKVVYQNKTGKMVVFKLKVASDIATGILDQTEIVNYDLIILGASDTWRQSNLGGFWDPALSEKVAVHAPCSVLVARNLEIGHGHLVCIDGSDKAAQMLHGNAILAGRCGCPISLICVAADEKKKAQAQGHIANAKKILAGNGVETQDARVLIGAPVKKIVEAGLDYSLIVLSDTSRSGLKRFFMGSVAFKVMEEAHNSVMIVR